MYKFHTHEYRFTRTLLCISTHQRSIKSLYHVFQRLCIHLHISHYQAIFQYLTRVIYHFATSLHIQHHLHVYIPHSHQLYHHPNHLHINHHQHVLVYLFHKIYYFSILLCTLTRQPKFKCHNPPLHHLSTLLHMWRLYQELWVKV